MRFLKLLSEQPMRGSELAQATGSKWSTAHRTLSYLRDQGYITRDDSSGVYYVGRSMYSIGIAYLDNHVLVQASRALLGPVAEASGGIVQVAEREGRTSIVLAHVEPRIAYGGVGRRLPLHIGARGQVLLAFAGAEFIEEYVSQPLEPVGENSITDRAELLEVLQKVREQDHVVSTREINALRVGVAAPVRNADDEVIAAAAIIRSSDDGVLPEPATRQVIDLARSLSIYAGWRID